VRSPSQSRRPRTSGPPVAVRLYERGWTIRQVADRFEVTYGVMRRILQRHGRLRNRGGTGTSAREKAGAAAPYGQEQHEVMDLTGG
jgi:transposase